MVLLAELIRRVILVNSRRRTLIAEVGLPVEALPVEAPRQKSRLAPHAIDNSFRASQHVPPHRISDSVYG